MLVREYRESDLDTLRRIHVAQEFPFAFPDLRDPLFLTKMVVTTGDEKILGAALLRLTAEAYLLLDPQQGSPRQRWQALLALHSAAQHDAQQRGLEDLHAWLPPRIARTFRRHIERLRCRRRHQRTRHCKPLSR